MQESHGITEIGLRRSPCFGKCPVYRVTLYDDGHLEYVGERYVERLGHHTGRINPEDFHALATFIREADFMALEDRYATPLTCKATVYTMVVMDGVRKEVSNYGGGGPPVLETVEARIDSLLLAAGWDEA
jgi:hypothetical protein